jgi:hypothetical protein
MNPVVVMGGALLLAFYYKKGPYCCWVRTQVGRREREAVVGWRSKLAKKVATE